MVRAVRTSLSGRLAAAVVALAMTGAPALAAHPETIEHRCLCKTHARDHECECARCHEESRRREAAERRGPPCHHAAAKGDEQAPRRGAADGPCITGTCGGTDGHVAPLTSLDDFTLPLAVAPTCALPPSGNVERPSRAQPEAPKVPDTPPPRAARAPAERA